MRCPILLRLIGIVIGAWVLSSCQQDRALDEGAIRQELVGYRFVWDGPYPADAPSEEIRILADGRMEIIITELMVYNVRTTMDRWVLVDDLFCQSNQSCYRIYRLADQPDTPPRFRFDDIDTAQSRQWRRVGKIDMP